MTDGNDISTRIRAWMEGRMSDSERAAFEADRAADPELDQEVKLALIMRAGLAQELLEQQREALRTLLKEDSQDAETSEQKQGVVRQMNTNAGTRKLWSYMAIAASVLVLAGLIWTLVLKPAPAVSPADLFAQYYEVPAAPEHMGSVASADSLLRLGHAAYNQEAYDKALSLYQLAIDQGLEPSKSPWLYLGIAAIEQGDITKARASVEKARALQPEPADWYLAMIELRAENKKEAREVLTKIANTDKHYYQNKAKEVLEDL
jgi:tetratricopeptide (TPR) repeat protein